MKHSRKVAAETLMAIYGGGQAQETLAKNLNTLPQGERQFCTDLVYGVLRARIRIKRILDHFLYNSAKLPPLMLALLDTAAYSILFQRGQPDYAVLNETVNLIKKHHGQKLANVGNGVLRALARHASELQEPAWYGANSESVYYGMPDSIAGLWRSAYGAENARKLLARSFERPWTGLRVNRAHPLGETVLAHLREAQGAVAIATSGAAFPPGKLPGEIMGQPIQELDKSGILSFQAAGSQEVVARLGLPESWQRTQIWDACAGSGGKTALFIEQGASVTLVSDVSKTRLARVRQECLRLGLGLPALVYADLAKPPVYTWQGNILIDAPCSGLGVLARRPDIKLRFDRRQYEKLLELQAAILGSACSLLAPGYELAYLTCTLNPAENQNQIAKAMARGMELVAKWETPHEHPWLEGMYGARLRKPA